MLAVVAGRWHTALMRRRAGAAVLVALLATACGNGSSGSAVSGHGDNDVLAVIQAAAKSTAQQQSMKVRGTMTMDLGAVTGGASSGPMSVHMSGTMQTKPVLGRLVMSGLSVAGQSVGDITTMITPDAIYMKMPMLTAETGKPWAVLKFSEMKSMSGFDMSQFLSQSQQMQPAQYIEQLTASGDVHVVGSEKVNGIDTTHYAGTVSLEESLAHYSPAVRAQMKPLMEKAGFTGSDMDLWLDDKGLVRRVKAVAEGGTGSLSFAMDVLAYGVEVDVTPPPADQVVDLARVASGGSFG